MPEQAYVPVKCSLVWSLKLGIQGGLQTKVRSHLRAEFDPLLTKGSEKAFFPEHDLLDNYFKDSEMQLLEFQSFLRFNLSESWFSRVWFNAQGSKWKDSN